MTTVVSLRPRGRRPAAFEPAARTRWPIASSRARARWPRSRVPHRRRVADPPPQRRPQDRRRRPPRGEHVSAGDPAGADARRRPAGDGRHRAQESTRSTPATPTENEAVTREAALDLLRRNSAAAAAAIRAFSDEQLAQAAPVSLYADAPLTCQFILEDHARAAQLSPPREDPRGPQAVVRPASRRGGSHRCSRLAFPAP